MLWNLAPPATRRDVAMPGLIHRTVMKKGLAHFREHFMQGEDGKLVDPRDTNKSPLVRRSALGLVAIYNRLPAECTCEKNVRSFQRKLQQIVKDRASEGCKDWPRTFSPRLPLQGLPLA